MRGILVEAEDNIAKGESVSFEAYSTKNKQPFISVRNKEGKEFFVQKHHLMAVKSECLADVQFLMEIDKEMSSHKKILIFSSIWQSRVGTYLYESDPILDSTNVFFLRESFRGVFSSIVADMALESSLDIYIANQVQIANSQVYFEIFKLAKGKTGTAEKEIQAQIPNMVDVVRWFKDLDK